MAIETEAGHAVLDEVRRLANRFPDITERLSHGTPTFFIRDKKVLCSVWEDHHGDGELALWCPAPPGVQVELVEREPDRFFAPKYVAHRGWIGVRLDVEPDWEEVGAVLDDAFRLVAPKSLVAQFDASSRGRSQSMRSASVR